MKSHHVDSSETTKIDPKLEAVRDALWPIQLKALREAIQEGIDSGPGIPAEEVFAELEARYSDKPE